MSEVPPGANHELPSCVSQGYVRMQYNDQKKKTKKIRATIFFDGTLNNRTNVHIGLDQNNDLSCTKVYNQKANDTNNSYENYYSNIHFLEKFIDIDDAKGHDQYISIYVEGVATIDLKKDNVYGNAFGLGETGIKEKVKKCYGSLKGNIKDFLGYPDPKVEVEEIRIDVFGFSRGAAAARHFINLILNSDPLKEALNKEQYHINNVKVHFVGLFDTVASFGIIETILEESNVPELGLDAIRNAESVFHIKSENEHRLFFALTDITSAGNKGKEVSLPGAHSDIGGGYKKNVIEKFQISLVRLPNLTQPDSEPQSVNSESVENQLVQVENDLGGLIEEKWFQKTDLFFKDGKRKLNTNERIREAVNYYGQVIVQRSGSKAILDYNELEGISNLYSRIPLHLMVRKATAAGLLFSKNFDIDPDTNLTKGQVPATISDFNDLVIKKDGDVTKNDLEANLDLLYDLRKNYLHFSASYKEGIGNTIYPYRPRYENDARKRKIHTG